MIQQTVENGGQLQALSGPPPRAPAVGRLGIIEQLLGDLETATFGGQGYMMSKIIGLLRDEAGQRSSYLSALQRRWIARSLQDLSLEPQRMLPDSVAFASRVQNIVDLFSVY